MRFIKRLMEIKERQLELEDKSTETLFRMDIILSQILNELKGGKKDGKHKN